MMSTVVSASAWSSMPIRAVMCIVVSRRTVERYKARRTVRSVVTPTCQFTLTLDTTFDHG